MTFLEFVYLASTIDFLVFFVLLTWIIFTNGARRADRVTWAAFYLFLSLAIVAVKGAVWLWLYRFNPTAWWNALPVANFMVADKLLLWSMVDIRIRRRNGTNG